MYSIEEFRNLSKPENIIITIHSRKRLMERGIKFADILNVIEKGEIIEDYEEDYPFPSCLILGESKDKKIHIVVSINEGMIYLITAYIPDPLKWENDFKTRKEE